jgi:hypothetical protein
MLPATFQACMIPTMVRQRTLSAAAGEANADATKTLVAIIVSIFAGPQH